MSEQLIPIIEIDNHSHYSYQIKLLIDAYNNGELPEVEAITVEPKYGYVASILYKSGARRVIYGHDSGFNPGSSESLAKDKGYTKFMLRSIGVDCPDGEEFLLPWWADRLRESERQAQNSEIVDSSSADEYVRETFGFPVIVKPVSGSQGVGVTMVGDSKELYEVLDDYDRERVKVALVEKALNMPDYRLLVFDGQLVNAYERKPLSVTGDGVRSIGELIDQRNSELLEVGRDVHIDRQMPNIHKKLGRAGLVMSSVLPIDEVVRLLDISNLSAGGEPYDVTKIINQRWVDLANEISGVFNLRICGVDLACANIESGDSEYSVLEVNATPGAMQFMAASVEGREKLQEMFIRFFRTDA